MLVRQSVFEPSALFDTSAKFIKKSINEQAILGIKIFVFISKTFVYLQQQQQQQDDGEFYEIYIRKMKFNE